MYSFKFNAVGSCLIPTDLTKPEPGCSYLNFPSGYLIWIGHLYYNIVFNFCFIYLLLMSLFIYLFIYIPMCLILHDNNNIKYWTNKNKNMKKAYKSTYSMSQLRSPKTLKIDVFIWSFSFVLVLKLSSAQCWVLYILYSSNTWQAVCTLKM